MERTQISLESRQADLLRRLAEERGTSMAHLIRDAVDLVYGSAVVPPGREQAWARALAAMGCGSSGMGDIALKHDEYLDEAFTS